ncbi:alpha/beta fold hydrolase [Actinoplanes sp. NPDC049668]|uniref:alpha/beta fold hydrolase n=1 Tax=unclassified Actinoplanes TaxID=2626549 RepID=UPI0033AA0784
MSPPVLAYRRVGGGRPIVWLHGGSGPDWDEIAASLSGEYLSYIPDLRGYGASSRLPPFGPEAAVGDVIALLDHLGLASAVLAGHSSGGIVAYLTALAHPDRVSALVLAEAPPPRPHDLRPVRPDGELPYEWAARRTTLDWLRDPDPAIWDRLAEIEAPTLVIAGGPRSPLSQDSIAEMAARIPSACLVTIDAGHLVHKHRPADFASAVSAFLRRLPHPPE